MTAQKYQQTFVSQLRNKSYGIVLMHDSIAKSISVEALPGMIKHAKEHGYRIRALTNENYPVQF